MTIKAVESSAKEAKSYLAKVACDSGLDYIITPFACASMIAPIWYVSTTSDEPTVALKYSKVVVKVSGQEIVVEIPFLSNPKALNAGDAITVFQDDVERERVRHVPVLPKAKKHRAK